MITNNPFFQLTELVPSIFMKLFVILMIILVVLGTFLDIIHKKNVKYFFLNAKKAKDQAKKTLTSNEKILIISKTISNEILTTSELG